LEPLKLPPVPSDEPPRLPIFGFPVHDLTWDGALAFVSERASMPIGQTHISFLNANNANIMLVDQEYREILSGHVVLPDGIGMDMASRSLNGMQFSANLNGTDFVPALLTYMTTKKRIGLVGGHEEVLSATATRLKEHSPWHDFVEIADGFFDKEDSSAVIEILDRSELDILLVAMGTPLQEKWIHYNVAAEHARVVMGVGALFDFVSGRVPRAPVWVRHLRCEWAYRLWIEPSRLWYRYVVGIPVFLVRVMQYKFATRRERTPETSSR